MTFPHQPHHPPPPGRRRRPLLIGVVAAAVVAVLVAAVLVLVPSSDAGGPGVPVAAPDPQAAPLEQVGRVTKPRPPKDEGPPTGPEPELTRIRDGVVYTAFHTRKSISFTAFDVERRSVVWERTLRLPEGAISSVAFEIVDGGLILEGRNADGYEYTLVLNPGTGETVWDLSLPVGCDRGCHHGGRLIAYDTAANQQNAFDVRTGEQVWSVPERTDEPSFTWIPQQTAESLAAPGDPQDHEQRYVGHGQKATGATKIIETTSGRIVAEGALGEKVTDYVLVGDVLYVYRKTPRELAAYRADDLGAPLWTQPVPAADDGSALVACDETTLCLTLLQGDRRTLHAIDTAAGATRWELGDRLLTGQYETRSVGGPIAVTTKDSTMLLDPASGEVLETFAATGYTYAGAGLILLAGPDGHLAYDAARRAPVDLGPEFGAGLDPATCVWAEGSAACADPEASDPEITFWRYRA
ncbi:PQQ-binding-like beta-propeller repeat protein [Pseudonocardia zijingensis]|jgi:outer membrane protein assembly factor BamB|uniref:Pyrrolo-quinoline quinone repeat domain-containing protein n=1 Tax=Pseudonocardia zijingensis TaxID=153376 RepID=A0ABP3ZCZ8_9PSEU